MCKSNRGLYLTCFIASNHQLLGISSMDTKIASVGGIEH